MANGSDDISSVESALTRARAVDKSIGRRIEARRVQLGMSASDLAGAMKLSAEQVTTIEAGIERPSPRLLLELSTLLRCSVRSFFLGMDQGQAVGPVTPEKPHHVLHSEHAATKNAICDDVVAIVSIYGRLPGADRQLVIEFAKALAKG